MWNAYIDRQLQIIVLIAFLCPLWPSHWNALEFLGARSFYFPFLQTKILQGSHDCAVLQQRRLACWHRFFSAVFHVNCRQWSGSRNSLTSRPWPRLCATRPWLVRLVLGMLRCKWIKWQSQLLTVRAYLVLAQMNSFNETTSNDSLPGQFMKWADQKMTFLDPHVKCDMPRLVWKIST